MPFERRSHPPHLGKSRRRKLEVAVLPTAEAMAIAFQEFLALDVAEGNAALDTVDTYNRRIKRYLAWCEDNAINPALASQKDIKLYRYYLINKSQKPATISLTLSVVRRFYAAAVQEGLVKENPALGIRAPKDTVDRSDRLEYLEVQELGALLAAIPKDNRLKSLRDLALIGIMALQGPRTVEIHRANIGDLQRSGDNWGLKVFGKGRMRTIPLRSDLAEVLQEYLIAREAEFGQLALNNPLFIAVGNRYGGNRLSRRGVRYIVDEYLKAVSLKGGERGLSAHNLRHTAGTLGLRACGDLRQVQDLLGHQDPQTTSLYARASERYESNPALGIEIDF
jgi:site-specific recombinase XerD